MHPDEMISKLPIRQLTRITHARLMLMISKLPIRQLT